MLLGAPDGFRVNHQSFRKVHAFSQHPSGWAALHISSSTGPGDAAGSQHPSPSLVPAPDSPECCAWEVILPWEVIIPWEKHFQSCFGCCLVEVKHRMFREVTAYSTPQCMTPREIPAGFHWALQPPQPRVPLVWLRKARVLPLPHAGRDPRDVPAIVLGFPLQSVPL